ncbi:hypothetical protein COOONC_27113, partial [Cooperia oncophora]
MCFDNGVHYSIGDTFRNGSFRLTCGRDGIIIEVIGCVRDGQQYNIAQVFTDRHVRYQCKNDGSLDVLGCVDEGLFLDLGRDLLMNGMVHRCYQVGMTTFYHNGSFRR